MIPPTLKSASAINLPHEVVIGFDGKMTARPALMPVSTASTPANKSSKTSKRKDFWKKPKTTNSSAAVCYRCGTIIEPLVSEQWFMKMKDMAARAAEATATAKSRFSPLPGKNPTLPGWTTSATGASPGRSGGATAFRCIIADSKNATPFASVEERRRQCPQHAERIHSRRMMMCSDTWFSSALWPLSVFGWPEETDGSENILSHERARDRA